MAYPLFFASFIEGAEFVKRLEISTILFLLQYFQFFFQVIKCYKSLYIGIFNICRLIGQVICRLQDISKRMPGCTGPCFF